jgi:hypothetical protein
MVISRMFWHQNFMAGCHTKVAINYLSLSPSLLGSYHVSKLKQQRDDHPMRKESLLPELPCTCQLKPSNHIRESSPRVLQVPLFFGKHHFKYMHVCVCFS